MPTRKSFQAALALGSAALFGAMGLMVLLGGAMTHLATANKEWSPGLSAEAMSGVSLMYLSGVVMFVLTVVLIAAGLLLSRGSDRA